MPLLTRFLAYYRPHRRLFLLDFSCAVASGLLELGFPVAVQAFIDRLLPGRDWGMILLAGAGLHVGRHRFAFPFLKSKLRHGLHHPRCHGDRRRPHP